ncbi:hypothetical protein [Bdellovibrio sp. KM01]|uniref:hypothetical protein n=1 Tax=Bdellovibrio sp. KM01 TaxID=2748865 RepID=UPI0015EA97A4|nr:hypothetical protein [Bdellovibrio sp. KM01]QLY24246.1 hypothetical protein HW988_12315 [Bdellovibrio sp. KM01]
MKSVKCALVAGLVLATTVANATTIAAQSLKCGGLIAVDIQSSNSGVLSVTRVGRNSTCENVKVSSLGVNKRIPNEGLNIRINPKALGKQVAIIVDGTTDSEVVVLNVDASAVASAAASERKAAEDKATAVAVGGAVAVGAAAITAGAVEEGER